jgi:hypothetical protein
LLLSRSELELLDERDALILKLSKEIREKQALIKKLQAILCLYRLSCIALLVSVALLILLR